MKKITTIIITAIVIIIMGLACAQNTEAAAGWGEARPRDYPW